MIIPKKDFTGQRFRSVVVVCYMGIRPVVGIKFITDQHHWLVKCDCERLVEVSYSKLVQLGGPSCGSRTCPYSKKPKSKAFFPPSDHTFRTASAQVRRRYKNGASVRGLSFDLNEDQFYQLITSPCHYSGVPPQNAIETKQGTFYYGGIDRKNSTLGYSVENCVPCCSLANYAKKDHSYEKFIAWLDKLSDFRTTQKASSVIALAG